MAEKEEIMQLNQEKTACLGGGACLMLGLAWLARRSIAIASIFGIVSDFGGLQAPFFRLIVHCVPLKSSLGSLIRLGSSRRRQDQVSGFPCSLPSVCLSVPVRHGGSSLSLPSGDNKSKTINVLANATYVLRTPAWKLQTVTRPALRTLPPPPPAPPATPAGSTYNCLSSP